MNTIELLVATIDQTWYTVTCETEDDDIVNKPYEQIVEWCLNNKLRHLMDDDNIACIAVYNLYNFDSEEEDESEY